jgi:hypothetical protein
MPGTHCSGAWVGPRDVIIKQGFKYRKYINERKAKSFSVV